MKNGIAWQILVEVCLVELKNDLSIGLDPDCRPQIDVIPQNALFWCFKERISSGSQPEATAWTVRSVPGIGVELSLLQAVLWSGG